jgi:F0F1-type ATP synthase membrane subunit b/b'
MNELLGTILTVGSLLGATAAFIWVAVRLGNVNAPNEKQQDFNTETKTDVEHIFNDEFREELRNRGRLHFEKIIGENAMFLQQDLRLTTSQISEFMKKEITDNLKESFTKYEESISDAKQLALDSIGKTQQAIEGQRKIMEEQLEKAVAEEKKRLITRFENNMADIVNHYVLNAIGNQISLDDQLEYILGELEENKKEILQDINSGA